MDAQSPRVGAGEGFLSQIDPMIMRLKLTVCQGPLNYVPHRALTWREMAWREIAPGHYRPPTGGPRACPWVPARERSEGGEEPQISPCLVN